MSTPMQTQSALGQQLIDTAAELWMNAGEQSDSANGLGIDDRITLVHNIIDLWVKGWAAAIQMLIKAPASWPGMQGPTEPMPSEIVEVAAMPYPRTLEAVGSFTRIGLPTVTIPPWAIGFQPSFLPAGITQFRLILKDHRYIGANYTGTIKLSAQAAMKTNIAPHQEAVIVGL